MLLDQEVRYKVIGRVVYRIQVKPYEENYESSDYKY